MKEFGKKLSLVSEAPRAPPAEAPQLRALEGHADAAQFRQLADMVFLPSQVLQPHERAYVIDLIRVALPASDVNERLNFARRLAESGSGQALLPALARDEDPEVARTILHSKAPLADDDLIDIATSGASDRRQLIASRPRLTSAVTTALARTGDISAISIALSNQHSEFSQPTLDQCIDRASSHAELRRPLSKRSEMSPAGALKLFWMLDANTRPQVLFRFLADNQALGRTAMAGRTVSSGAAHMFDENSIEFEQLCAYCGVGDPVKGSEPLAKLAGIRPVAAQRILADSGGEALAVTCKAAGMRRPHLTEVLERGRRSGLSVLSETADSEALSILFDRLSRGQARMAVTYWDWHAGGVGPYAENAATPSVEPFNVAEELIDKAGQPGRGVDAPISIHKEPEPLDLNETCNDQHRSLPRLKGPVGYLSEIMSS